MQTRLVFSCGFKVSFLSFSTGVALVVVLELSSPISPYLIGQTGVKIPPALRPSSSRRLDRNNINSLLLLHFGCHISLYHPRSTRGTEEENEYGERKHRKEKKPVRGGRLLP